MIVDVIRYYAGAVDKFFGHTIPVERDGVALTFREPIGVVGLITPWNFPLNIANWKTAPALAAGNTVVLKPASLTPLSVLRYAELAVEAGLPPGALNVVPGPGSTRRQRAGRASRRGQDRLHRARPRWAPSIARRAAATIKRVTLELGGKSAAWCSPTPTSRRWARWRRTRCSRTAARTAARARGCWSRSRSKTRCWSAMQPRPRAIRVGMPEDADTEVGPLISAGQRETVERYIAAGVDEGAHARHGRRAPGGELEDGLLPAADGARRRAQRHDGGPRGDLRPGRLA